MLEVGDGVFEVLSTSGDTHLGGDDFDKVGNGWMFFIFYFSFIFIFYDPVNLLIYFFVKRCC